MHASNNHGRSGFSQSDTPNLFPKTSIAPLATNTPANERHEYFPNALRKGSQPLTVSNFSIMLSIKKALTPEGEGESLAE
jgi:hypothetical protein